MDDQRPPGFIVALWFAFVAFVAGLFSKPPSAPALPVPVTARPPNATLARPILAAVRVISVVKEPTPLKRPASAATSPISSTARTTPACRSRSATPTRALPTSPFPNISLSGIFATPPLLASPRLASDMEPGLPILSPGSPCPFRATPSFHTRHTRSPCTPRTPSSAVIVRLDRSTVISPTTMSDGSLEVISLGDRRGFVGSPVRVPDMGRLPSPWSPIGKAASSDVWMSVDGMLMNATGPVAHSQDDSAASRIAMLSLSRTTSLYSSPSALDAFGISVFVNLDEVSSQRNNVDTSDDPTSVSRLNQVRDENRPTLVTQGPQTPRKRRETLPSVTSHPPSHSTRAAKRLSTPLTKLVDVSHVRSPSSISSMAYELRMGLFADGRSMTGFENIISLLDQASPESIPPHNDAMQPVEAG